MYMTIRILATGWTIDCSRIRDDGVYEFSETHIPTMLLQSRITTKSVLNVLFLKDSALLNDLDRCIIESTCHQVSEDKIIITHGTDTMQLTAERLISTIRNKTIVLVWSMIPYNRPGSDALFNLWSAFTAVQILPAWVYVTMNGKVFPGDAVVKDHSLGIFCEK